MQYICTSNLNPEADDIPHILLLNVRLHYLVMRSDMFDSICRNLALILLVAAQFESLALQVVQVRAFHAHGYEDLILMVETSPSCTGEGQTSHI
jgi:hypothetical protein